MRLVVAAAIFVLLLALGALEIYAARHVADLSASGVPDMWYAR